MSGSKKIKTVSVTRKVYWKVSHCSKDFYERKTHEDEILSETFAITIGDVSTKW